MSSLRRVSFHGQCAVISFNCQRLKASPGFQRVTPGEVKEEEEEEQE